MEKNPTCIGCKRESPPTNTAHTLFGPAHGWRVTRRTDARGEIVIEWRCRTCWLAYRAAKGGAEFDSVSVRRGTKRGE
jgi:hypothetical protein